jgi:hypothetical protein
MVYTDRKIETEGNTYSSLPLVAHYGNSYNGQDEHNFVSDSYHDYDRRNDSGLLPEDEPAPSRPSLILLLSLTRK